MSVVGIIAKNTFVEVVRDRILYAWFVVAVLLMGLSLALSELTVSEQQRLALNFGMMAIHLGVVILSIFIGSTLVSREIEKKTILTILTRPVERWQFLLGKFLGLSAINVLSVICLALVLAVIVQPTGVSIGLPFLQALLGMLLESFMLLALAIMFGCFSKPIMTVSFCIGMFLVGHWLESLKFFATQSRLEWFKTYGQILPRALPNLEVINWRSYPIYQEAVPLSTMGEGVAYTALWTLVLIGLAILILERRNFD